MTAIFMWVISASLLTLLRTATGFSAWKPVRETKTLHYCKFPCSHS